MVHEVGGVEVTARNDELARPEDVGGVSQVLPPHPACQPPEVDHNVVGLACLQVWGAED